MGPETPFKHKIYSYIYFRFTHKNASNYLNISLAGAKAWQDGICHDVTTPMRALDTDTPPSGPIMSQLVNIQQLHKQNPMTGSVRHCLPVRHHTGLL